MYKTCLQHAHAANIDYRLSLFCLRIDNVVKLSIETTYIYLMIMHVRSEENS